MKRSGFKRKPWKHEPAVEREPRPLAMPTVLPLVRGTYSANDSHTPTPKREYIRSPALMRAYRQIACQHCGARDGTVCGAHSNWADHGKGRSIKADDNRCASLCAVCHSLLDQGSMLGKAERMSMWFAAHALTVKELLKRGLWPKGVPVPELRWERVA